MTLSGTLLYIFGVASLILHHASNRKSSADTFA